jgi:hypothetical protein
LHPEADTSIDGKLIQSFEEHFDFHILVRRDRVVPTLLPRHIIVFGNDDCVWNVSALGKLCTKRTGSGWQSRCDALLMLTGSAGGNLDLNRSKGTIETTAVRADRDGDGRSTSTHAGLRGDWNALDYKGGGIIGNSNRLRRRDVVTEEPVLCQAPLDAAVATTESEQRLGGELNHDTP